MSDHYTEPSHRITKHAKKRGLIGDDDSKRLKYHRVNVDGDEDGETETWTLSVQDTKTETYGEPYVFRMKAEDLSLLSITRVSLTKEKLREVFQELKLGVPNEMTRSPIKNGRCDGVEYEVFVKDKKYTVYLTERILYDCFYGLLKALGDSKSGKQLQSLPVERRYEYTGPRVLDIYQVQVSQKLPWISGDFYYKSSIKDRINVVKQIAPVYKTLWEVDFESRIRICSIRAEDDPISQVPKYVDIGPVREKSVELGCFYSNSAYLKSWIRHCIDVMKYAAERRGKLTGTKLAISKMTDFDFKIPSEVEEVPVGFSCESIYISSMRFSPSKPHVLQDIHLPFFVKLQLLPFAESVLRIEQLFWLDENGSQKIHRDYQELHDAFWNEIPEWRECLESRATQTYLQWTKIGHVIRNGPDYQEALGFLRKHT